MRFSLELYDAVRIDHFRGFDTYYAIPYGAPNARKGEWRQGPGMRMWSEVLRALPGAAIVAEDLGEMFESVRALLKETGFPGMKVLQFAFGAGQIATICLTTTQRTAWHTRARTTTPPCGLGGAPHAQRKNATQGNIWAFPPKRARRQAFCAACCKARPGWPWCPWRIGWALEGKGASTLPAP